MLIFVCYAVFMHILFFLPNAQKIAIENCSCRLYIVVYFGTIAIYLVSYKKNNTYKICKYFNKEEIYSASTGRCTLYSIIQRTIKANLVRCLPVLYKEPKLRGPGQGLFKTTGSWPGSVQNSRGSVLLHPILPGHAAVQSSPLL